MNRLRHNIKVTWIFIILFALTVLMYSEIANIFPKNLMLIQGKEYTYKVNVPWALDITADKKDIIKLNGNYIESKNRISFKNPFRIKSEQTGKVNLKLKLFGRIPLKTVSVNIIPETYVLPCGNTVGVKIYTRGILVVGVSSIKGVDGNVYNPCSQVEEGDSIISVNGKNLKNITDFMRVIQDNRENPMTLLIERDGNINSISVTPVKVEDNKFKLGLWVRDSTSGIGTLTFFDAKTNKFGALGHGITDVDTGTLLSVGKGDILESSIISINKGEKGVPGELKGIFLNEDFKLGEISENNQHGIYGKIINNKILPNNAVIPVALRDEVKEGPAVILSNIDGRDVDAFTIDIQKILKNNYSTTKSMIIKITDKRLLNETGGIVQGMSGSPIIQNGKLVGAVTHVFVNDPTKGYGVFAELMIQNMNNIN